MQGEHDKQSSFFGMIYPDLVPTDHLLRRIPRCRPQQAQGLRFNKDKGNSTDMAPQAAVVLRVADRSGQLVERIGP